MRRDERAVMELTEIHDILQRCDTIRVAMNDGEYPYVIPMTFGSEIIDGKIIIYFHSACAGKKWELLNKDAHVCIEADLYYQVKKCDNGDITAVYESVIGTGIAEALTEQADRVSALKVMLTHYKESGFPVTSCKGLANVEVFRVVLDDVSGKRNL